MSYLALSTAAHERVKYKDLLLNADSTHFCYSFMKRYKDNKYWAPKNLEYSCISSFTPMKKRFCELWTEISAGGAVAPFVFLIGCSKAELPCQKTRVLVGPRISPAPSYHADPCLLVFYPKREETKLKGVRYALNVIKSEIMFMFVWID